MNTIYVITTGEYSSYRIVTILSTKAMADMFCAHDENLHIETYTVDLLADQVAQGLGLYTVRMEETGDGLAWSYSTGEFQDLHVVENRRWDRSGPVNELFLQGCIWAKDEQHALKIANEHRAVIIESGNWKPPSRKRRK